MTDNAPNSSTVPPAVAPAPSVPETETAPRTRGYFNQGQLEDLDLAESILAAARAHSTEMTERDITAEWLDRLAAVIAEARQRSSGTGHGTSGSKNATTATEGAAKNLVTALKQIQSAAKQKHRMLAEDDDPETNFPTDGYLISRRLDASRALLLQNAAALIARAKADSLPGFRTPASIAAIETLLNKYRATEDNQQDVTLTKELSRISRDTLIDSINHRRSAIQHAADAAWPPAMEQNRPTRKIFSLPPNRSLGM